MRGESAVDLDTKQIDGACHCGTVRFRVRLSAPQTTVRIAGVLRFTPSG
jgi:hypothetical protein